MSNRDKYRIYAKDCHSIPLFLQPWWMDAVCGEMNWDVCLSFDKGGNLQGVLPYFLKKKWGLTSIRNPYLTPYSGVWIIYADKISPWRKSQWEKRIMAELISQLPPYTWFSLRCHTALTNWLPFYWKGFSQTIQYTSLIKPLKEMPRIYKGIHRNIKETIRQAQRSGVTIQRGSHLFQTFCLLYESASAAKGLTNPPMEVLTKIHEAVQMNQSGEIFIARDNCGQPLAYLYLLYDINTAYAWLGGRNPYVQLNGAYSFMFWEAIKQSSQIVNQFDVDGSMNSGIEQFLAAWGGTLTPCFVLTKSSNFFWETLLFIKNRLL